MGEHLIKTTTNSNRELLIETRRESEAITANAYFEHPPEHLVTYYAPAPGVGPASDITDKDLRN
eukprot:2422158-Pyramimonas_sp.AAC.1